MDEEDDEPTNNNNGGDDDPLATSSEPKRPYLTTTSPAYQVAQRFATTVLYYATDGGNWETNQLWLEPGVHGYDFMDASRRSLATCPNSNDCGCSTCPSGVPFQRHWDSSRTSWICPFRIIGWAAACRRSSRIWSISNRWYWVVMNSREIFPCRGGVWVSWRDLRYNRTRCPLIWMRGCVPCGILHRRVVVCWKRWWRIVRAMSREFRVIVVRIVLRRESINSSVSALLSVLWIIQRLHRCINKESQILLLLISCMNASSVSLIPWSSYISLELVWLTTFWYCEDASFIPR